MYPAKPNSIYIQTKISPQFHFNTVSLRIQTDICSNITTIDTKTTFSDRGKID